VREEGGRIRDVWVKGTSGRGTAREVKREGGRRKRVVEG